MQNFIPRSLALITLFLLIAAGFIPGAADEAVLARGDDNYPPYEFLDSEGNPMGFNIDLFRAVSSTMGINATISLGSWNEVRSELENGSIDLLTGMYYSPERARNVNFSNPYIAVSHAVFVRKGSRIGGIEDLSNATVIVQEGDIMHDYALKSFSPSRVIPIRNQADALILLSSGQYDAALLAKLQAVYNMKRLGIENLVSVGPPVEPRDYCFAVSMRNQPLVQKLNEGLAIIRHSGEYDRIYRRWFGGPEEELFTTRITGYLMMVLIPVLGLGVILVTWLWSLRRQVAIKTRDLREELERRRRAESELSASEIRNKSLLSAIPDMIFVFSRDGTYLDFHAPDPGQLALPPRSLIGKTFREIGLSPEAETVVEERIRKTLETSKIQEFEYTLSLPGGEGVFEARMVPLDQERVLAIVRDVTGMRLTETKLSHREKTLLEIQQIAHISSFEWNLSTDVIEWTDEFFSIAARKRGSFPSTGEGFLSLIYPEDREMIYRGIDAARGGKPDWHAEFRITLPDGGFKWLVSSGRVETVPMRIIGYIQDIHERKSSALQLARSEARLYTLVQTIPDLVWLKDPDGAYITCNPIFERFIGVKRDAIMGKTDFDFFEPDLAEFFREHDRKAIQSGKSAINEEWITFADDGHRALMETIKTPMYDTDGTLIGVLGIGRDITERKAIEARIALQNQKLKDAEAIGNVGSWEYDLSTGTIWGSDEGFRIYGMVPPTDGRLPIGEIEACIPERDRVHQALVDLIEEGKPYNLEFSIKPADGSSERTIISIAGLISDETGIPIKVSGVIQDITLRKQGERERDDLIRKLRKSNEDLAVAYEDLSSTEEELRFQYNTLASTEEHLRQTTDFLENLITYANVPIIVWDSSFTITRINHAFENLTGMKGDEIIGISIEILFPPDSRDQSMRLLMTTRAGVRWNTVELEILHRNGPLRKVIWNSSTIYSSDGITPVATIAQGQDVTLRRKLEKENELSLQQIQKNLAQLSILNDGIRNPLAVITLLSDLTGSEETAEKIKQEITRINEMVTQLDHRWLESEKVLDILRSHYRIEIPPTEDTHTLRTEKGFEIDKETTDSDRILSVKPVLEEIQAELYTILDSFEAVIFIADLRTNEMIYLNRQGRALYGDYAGKTCYETIQKDQQNCCAFSSNDLLTGDGDPAGVIKGEHQNTKDGRWYEYRDQAIRWSDGRLVHLQVATDITDRKETELKLGESEYISRTLFEESFDPILLVKEGTFIECNQATLDLLQYPDKRDFIGTTIKDISPQYQPDGRRSERAAEEYIAQAHREGKCRFEWMCLRYDKSPLILEISLLQIVFKGETMLHATFRDVTLRKTNEEDLKTSFQTIFDAIGNPTVILDRNHRILDANRATIDLLGRNIEELFGKYCWKIFHGEETVSPPERCPFRRMQLKRAHETGTMEVETLGEVFLVSCTPVFSENGDIDRVIHIAVNITQKSRIEESLRQASLKLQLLTSLTRHDIINQLAVMHSAVDAAAGFSHDEKLTHYLDYAKEAANRIEYIIGITRDYEIYGAVSSDWRLVHEVIDSAILEISSEKIEIINDIPEDIEFYADPIIRKVFSTLIDNTIRHGMKATYIRFFCEKRESELYIISSDDGVGIPDADKDKIFLHGYGSHTGIGLFLAREILSITNLTILECGKEGRGARFEIRVPREGYRRGTDYNESKTG